MDISRIQNVISALDNIPALMPTAKTLRKIQSALDQFRVLCEADSLTFYVRNPWSKVYEIRHVSGVTHKEFMWDRTASGSVGIKIDQWLGNEIPNHYIFFDKQDLLPAEPTGSSFVERENIHHTGLVFAYPQGTLPASHCNAVCWVNWTRPPEDMTDPWLEELAPWIKLLSESLHHAVRTLIYESRVDVELQGRHLALAARLNDELPRMVSKGADSVAHWMEELAGGQGTSCRIFQADRVSENEADLRLITGPEIDKADSIRFDPNGNIPVRVIAARSASLNKLIYVDNFRDSGWSEDYDSPGPDVVSELAIPIMIGAEDNQTVRYVVSLRRNEASAFGYEEIGLLKSASTHLEAFLKKARETMNAVCHDPGNLAMIFSSQQEPSLGYDRRPEDVLAIAQIVQWSLETKDLIAAAVCGLPILLTQETECGVREIAERVRHALMVYDSGDKTGLVVDIAVDSSWRASSAGAILGQILWNITFNAFQAMRTKLRSFPDAFADHPPHIWIAVEYDEGQPVLVITDSGPGIEVNRILHKIESGGDVHGWGLFIANTCARAVGGSLTPGNRTDGLIGARMVVELGLVQEPGFSVR